MTLRQTLDHYRKVFGEYPPTAVWQGSDEDLEEVVQRAINSRTALDEEALIVAQGFKAPPEGVLL
jgi:hypothetical protein